MRVQIPAYTDRWMRGDRYGEVVKIRRLKSAIGDKWVEGREVVHVKLDKSGKTLPFMLSDCTEVS